jgi:hypothetical protein
MTTRLSPQDLPWEETLARCIAELERLSPRERRWLNDRLTAIAVCQSELDRLFRTADGPAACASCHGRCCDCGRHHFTLTNLLGYLLRGLTPPLPDYSCACPFAGAQGCRLEVSFRPFNCVIFLCEEVEAGLDTAGKARFDHLEKQLRREYEAVAGRYQAASMRGLLIALERAGERPLLLSTEGQE